MGFGVLLLSNFLAMLLRGKDCHEEGRFTKVQIHTFVDQYKIGIPRGNRQPDAHGHQIRQPVQQTSSILAH